MLRTRLAAAAFLSFTLLPGCGLFCCDRPRLLDRWCECRRGGACEGTPVSYPMADAGCPCGMPVPNGAPIVTGPYGGAPIMGAPVYPGGGLTETLPPPYAPGTPRIPKAGIDEGKGKQFELEGASRSGGGPVLAVPAAGSK